jgi:hypothetical protein
MPKDEKRKSSLSFSKSFSGLARKKSKASVTGTQNNNVPKSRALLREDLSDKLSPTDHLLGLLSAPESAYYLKAFVTKKFCGETLSFWTAIEHYRNLDPSQYFSHAKAIYDSYLIRGAEKEVNIENEQRDLDLSDPQKTTFDHLQRIAWQLLVTSDYPKFVTSQEYKHFIGSYYFSNRIRRNLKCFVQKSKSLMIFICRIYPL